MFGKVLNIASRAFYFVFFLLDNIYIILKMVNGANPKTRDLIKYLARRFQLVGQLLFLIYCMKTLRQIYTDESDLKVAALNKMTVKQFQDNLQVIGELRNDYLMNFGRAFCDFVICLNENDLPLRMFGIRMN